MFSFVSLKAFMPSTVTASSGLVRCRPPRMRRSVDLPAPLAPMRRQLCMVCDNERNEEEGQGRAADLSEPRLNLRTGCRA